MTATTDGSTGAANITGAPADDPTDTRTAADDVTYIARQAAERSVEHLLGRQDEQGWWKGDLATNVTMDAEDLL
ncbi:squalene--hopene cyclase, partial [Streptomyces sp. SID7982]|nr:squalene--hopene cyclase [Streptomyces sp. SID7982]